MSKVKLLTYLRIGSKHLLRKKESLTEGWLLSSHAESLEDESLRNKGEITVRKNNTTFF